MTENLNTDSLGGLRPEFAATPGNDIRAARPRLPALPRRGSHLLWRIAGFIVALVVITVASHFIGGVAGLWAEQQWAPPPTTRAAPNR